MHEVSGSEPVSDDDRQATVYADPANREPAGPPRRPPKADPAEDQIDRLARFIMQNIPGEPSRSESAVDTAIRLLDRLAHIQEEFEALHSYLDALAAAQPDEWKRHMLQATSTIVRMWHLEAVPEWKQRARCAESRVAELESALAAAVEPAPSSSTGPQVFVLYRTASPEEHDSSVYNPPDIPTLEGCLFSDGRVAVRWLTPYRSTVVWDAFSAFQAVHITPHPQYLTRVVWGPLWATEGPEVTP